ncbi:MAG: secreted protein, partial [Planctomycetaceae bacterium]|nr:secreted protein [Planctomycetaceae bacterium]
ERTTAAGVSGSVIRWLGADAQNTVTLEVAPVAGTVTRRYADPFGNPRGPVVAWSSPHGYLNAPQSPFSGLTTLGARQYDATLGRFLSVDAVLSPFNPQQNDGYSYARNNPVTMADPSGNCYVASLGAINHQTNCAGGKGQMMAAAENKQDKAAVTPDKYGITPAQYARIIQGAIQGANDFLQSGTKGNAYGNLVGGMCAQGNLAGQFGYPCSYAQAAATDKMVNSGVHAVGVAAGPLAATCMGDFAQPICWGGAGAEGAVGVIGKGLDDITAADEAAQSTFGAASAIKQGSAGGSSAGLRFPKAIKDAAKAENPDNCVYCHMTTTTPQVDHVIPRSVGGNATLENAQITCPSCNASKGARPFPLSAPPGYEGTWPPQWWRNQ